LDVKCVSAFVQSMFYADKYLLSYDLRRMQNYMQATVYSVCQCHISTHIEMG